ncbi:hypothetical protein [Flammeovirga sp. OC4]|uniref:hypothetical protein n=1 Tax=Flammeovirga sp. OC4 TaxID=1382345 RepID=UPI0005C46061|nr:hypothetical protein [Flammeovirga sp. OC4]
MKKLQVLLLLLLSNTIYGQSEFDFNGMLVGFTTYSPEAEQLNLWSGGRYIPEAKFEHQFDSLNSFSAFASANIYGSVQYANGTPVWDGTVLPYRGWVRYAHGNSEIRVGLQKIDFGSSTLLRPMQWFNQIDPRDPLGLTNGVYSALARYYFKNNANIWFWALYGNKEQRGYDALQSVKDIPELGGRVQLPTPKGEIAFSYHHRKAVLDTRWNAENPMYIETPENRVGIDGKWDLLLGVWFEGTYTKTNKNVGILTNQTLLDLGMDYTLPIGSGLNVVGEHLFTWYGEEFNHAEYKGNTTAISMNYPLSYFDNISVMVYRDWTNSGTGFFTTYNHDFDLWTGYFMIYYNPTTDISSPIATNDLNQFTPGFGVRLMAVLNH